MKIIQLAAVPPSRVGRHDTILLALGSDGSIWFIAGPDHVIDTSDDWHALPLPPGAEVVPS